MWRWFVLRGSCVCFHRGLWDAGGGAFSTFIRRCCRACVGLRRIAVRLRGGYRQHGCSVHLVTEELDAGEILGQERLDIKEGDSPESLAERVLKLEHRLYPRVLADYVRERSETCT